MSSSAKGKLDYLSKYMGDSKQKKKKDKKKKQKTKQSGYREDDGSDSYDGLPQTSLDDEMEEEDEDGPVVVASSELPASSISELEPTNNGKQIDTTSHYSQSKQNKEVSRKRRYDSSSEEETLNNKLLPQGRSRQRHDSSSSDEGKRSTNVSSPQRHDSSDSDSEASSSRRKPRRRHDSDSDSSPEVSRRKQRFDSDDSDNGNEQDRNERTASGHRAGLQSWKDFSQQEGKIQSMRKDLAQSTVDKHGMGETIYRDKHGRKKLAKDGDEKVVDVVQQQLELNMGAKQKEQLLMQQQEMSKLSVATFARRADDDELETIRKQAIRKDDPMAKYAIEKTHSSRSYHGHKQMYSGPPAKPNRFGIRPGFRWDGIDRGNGFEDKLLARQYMKQHQAEQAHMMSTMDM